MFDHFFKTGIEVIFSNFDYYAFAGSVKNLLDIVLTPMNFYAEIAQKNLLNLNRPTFLALMWCPKCGYKGWERISMKGNKPMLWCPKDGMKREELVKVLLAINSKY